MIKKWDISDERLRKKCIEEVLTRIEEQEGADFGLIAAEDIIDIVAQYVGPDSFNKGIAEAKKAIQTKFADLDIQLDMLNVGS